MAVVAVVVATGAVAVGPLRSQLAPPAPAASSIHALSINPCGNADDVDALVVTVPAALGANAAAGWWSGDVKIFVRWEE